jgi:hypothetical protein
MALSFLNKVSRHFSQLLQGIQERLLESFDYIGHVFDSHVAFYFWTCRFTYIAGKLRADCGFRGYYQLAEVLPYYQLTVVYVDSIR